MNARTKPYCQSPGSRLALVQSARYRLRRALIELRAAEAGKAVAAVVRALKSIDGARRQLQQQVAKVDER